MTATTLTDRLFDDADKDPIDPFSLFEEWFVLAQQNEPNDPHAMALATVDEHGAPDVRAATILHSKPLLLVDTPARDGQTFAPQALPSHRQHCRSSQERPG